MDTVYCPKDCVHIGGYHEYGYAFLECGRDAELPKDITNYEDDDKYPICPLYEKPLKWRCGECGQLNELYPILPICSKCGADKV